MKVHFRVNLKEQLKMHEKVKLEKNGFDVAFDGVLEIALVSAIGDALESRSKDAPKSILRDLYKDVPENSFEVELKGAF